MLRSSTFSAQLRSTRISVRHVPDDVHAELRRRAHAAGVSLSEYVLQELERVAARPPMAEVFARSASRRIALSPDEVVAGIRADRDER
ncbi:FitA-like ribbon-helix-helix domain-containing protein [Geodermatophilus sp. DSM 44513]|uniref:FitA-like ribbon-helix-helix domain-containing protein n=1 Tax=Geodermatophilus sp. DSM 44513 TaxID=1528104 RepID=UPI0037BF3B72